MGRARRCLILAAMVLVIALDWAALHDILKGNEPSLHLEYAMVISSIPALVLLALVGFKSKDKETDVA